MEGRIKNFLKQLRLNESLISTVIGVLIVLAVVNLLFNYFKSKITLPPAGKDVEISENQEIKTGEGMLPASLPQTHDVQKGETLWSIAEKYYGSGYNWVDIAKENNLKNPNQIETSQKLNIPQVSSRKQTVKSVNIKISADYSKATIQPASNYTVQNGDHLWGIAVRAYGDGYKWTEIYKSNREKIGPNPNNLTKGLQLAIPSL